MKHFSLLTALMLQVFLLAILVPQAQAQLDLIFGDFRYRVNQGKVTITNYTRKSTTGILEVPELIEGKPVTVIAD